MAELPHLALNQSRAHVMKDKSYKPGQVIPVSGVYRVEHPSHGLMHEATLIEQSPFPKCRQCADAVRFRLTREGESRHLLPFRTSAILEEFDAPASPFKVAS